MVKNTEFDSFFMIFTFLQLVTSWSVNQFCETSANARYIMTLAKAKVFSECRGGITLPNFVGIA
jgi:hypothetical protein